MPTLEDCKEDCTIIPIGTEKCRTAGASDFKERNPMNSEEQQSVFSIRSPSSALRLKKLPSLFKNSAEADLILPCCINPSKGKKRRAVATDGPLLNVATSKFWQTIDLSEPISHTSLLLHSGEQMLATEKIIIFLTQEEEDKPDVPSRTKNPTSAASPPYTPPRTPILTPRQGQVASPVTNVRSSCFGSLELSSPPLRASLHLLALEDCVPFLYMISRPAVMVFCHQYLCIPVDVCLSHLWDLTIRMHQEILQ